MITESQIEAKWSMGEKRLTLSEFLSIKNLDHATLYVGTDSQPFHRLAKFATTVCVLTPDYCSFIVKKFKIMHKPDYTVERRLMDEVHASVLVANYLTKLQNGVSIEVHADINNNPQFRSYKCMAAAKGYVEGMGYKYVGKPNSWAASSCADWHTK